MNEVFFPKFELVSNPKIILSDVKEGLIKGDLSGVRIFDGDKVTTYGECISSLVKLIGKENTEKIMENIRISEEHRNKNS